MLPYYKTFTIDSLNDIAAEVYAAVLEMEPEFKSIIDQQLTSFTNMIKPVTNLSTARRLKKFSKLCPTLVIWLESKDIQLKDIFSMTAVTVGPKSATVIHVDPHTKEFPSYYEIGEAINLPIRNCEDAYTSWYSYAKPTNVTDEVLSYVKSHEYAAKFGKSHQEIMLTGYNSGCSFDEDNAIEVARVRLLTPTYTRIDIPHCAINQGDKVRVLLSIRLVKQIEIDKL